MLELFGNFRELYSLICGERSPHLCERVVAPWIESNSGSRQWLHDFAHRSGNPIPPVEHGDLSGLYALSRVNDVLITPFQGNLFDGEASRSKDKLDILLPGYLLFAELLGLKKVEQPPFSSFHHEIVAVEESTDENQPVRLESTLWPCLMLGDMMFSRAGVRVSVVGNAFPSK